MHITSVSKKSTSLLFDLIWRRLQAMFSPKVNLKELFHFLSSRSPISVAAAAIYMASQASEHKKAPKGEVIELSVPHCNFFLGWQAALTECPGRIETKNKQKYSICFFTCDA
jgi:hypothetical protein